MKTVTTQKVLATTQISLADYVINPYRGCTIGCAYCYANENKDNHECAVKINAPQILEKELRFVKPKRVLLGSTTECFQKEDEQFKVTRDILTILNNKNIPYTILTKSHYIKDYLNIIAANKANKIYFTFNFHNDRLIHRFEKNSSSFDQRIEAINGLISYKIDLRIHAGPFIPGICDIDKLLESLPQGINEMDIEIYHNKISNFKKILEIVPDIENIYKNEQSYLAFAETIKEKLLKLKNNYPVKFYLIVPPYGQFYNPSTDYENTQV